MVLGESEGGVYQKDLRTNSFTPVGQGLVKTLCTQKPSRSMADEKKAAHPLAAAFLSGTTGLVQVLGRSLT